MIMPPVDENMFAVESENDALAVTFTLNFNYINKKYNVKLNLESYEIQSKICLKYLQNLLGNHVSYIIISECTNVGNWHAHGILKKMSKKFKHKGLASIKRNLGNICIKPIHDLKKWITYITKDGASNYIYNDNYAPDDKIKQVSFGRILKKEAEYYKKQDVRRVFTEDDFNCYKLAKARSHVMAAAKMFSKCKKKCNGKKKCIII